MLVCTLQPILVKTPKQNWHGLTAYRFEYLCLTCGRSFRPGGWIFSASNVHAAKKLVHEKMETKKWKPKYKKGKANSKVLKTQLNVWDFPYRVRLHRSYYHPDQYIRVIGMEYCDVIANPTRMKKLSSFYRSLTAA